MSYDSAAIANRFLELAEQAERQLTPMQLIKLSYIAHGFALAINKQALIDESVEAWKYGPVIPSLYRRLKHFGSNPVKGKVKPPPFRGHDVLSAGDQKLVDLVFEKYGHFTGGQLSHLTHRPGTPWAETYEPNSYGMDIDDAVIRTHYATLLAK
jgi:uncharacterized phage-associated protein